MHRVGLNFLEGFFESFTNLSLVLAQSCKHEGPSENRNHYSVLINCSWLVDRLILWRINHFLVIQSRIKFQTIQFSISFLFCLQTVKCQNSSISNNSVYPKFTVLMSKTVLLQTIQFSISTKFSSI